MAIDVTIPAVGESITQVQIAEWLKREGDLVKGDENLAVIDSEKTTFELPAPKGGRLAKILHPAGDTVKIGDVIAQIEPDGQADKAATKPKSDRIEPKGKDKTHIEKPEPSSPPEKGAAPSPSSPPTDQQPEQEEHKPEPAEEPKAEIPPAHPNKPEEDSSDEKRSSATPEPSDEVVPMTMLRRTVARRLVEAQQTMAMLTTFNEVDMSAAQALRKQHGEAFEKRYQVRLGLMSFFVKAAIEALKQFPKLNAEIRDEDIVYHHRFDIGVAIATERGLVVPVLRNAENLGFAEVEKHILDFASRARDGKLKPEDLAGGTFTITNGGVFGSLLSTPIINPPQTGILGMHTIQDRPLALAGQVVIRPMMYLALTYDHRLVDGRDAVLFLKRIKEVIEDPARMLVGI